MQFMYDYYFKTKYLKYRNNLEKILSSKLENFKGLKILIASS